MKTVLFFVSSPRPSLAAEGANRYAHARGWYLQVAERAFHKGEVRELLDFWHPIGIIAECGSGAEELVPEMFGDLPVVYFDANRSNRPNSFHIASDSPAVGRAAAECLLKLDLPHYAYASFRRPMLWNQERQEAFAAALAEQGRDCLMFNPPKTTDVRRRRALLRWVESLPIPCGVFAANDRVGEEVLTACTQLGRKVPEEIAVLGVDNDPDVCEQTTPTLSSIALDFRNAGYLAAELLGRIIDHPGLAPEIVTFAVDRIVARVSTRRLVIDRARIRDAVEFIRLHACEGIGVRDVVRRLGVNRRTAEIRFREATGRSILEEIDEIRFAKVFELLRNPRQEISAISDFAGFRTFAALRKAFKLRTGVSMREWRNSQK